MHKAYDRVEWLFLEGILLKLGFCEEWVKLLMQCVSTVEHSKPSRGFTQGDPLSPYSFRLCTEGLTALLNKGEEEGKLEGVKVCREAPAITNLLFADDSLIPMKANTQNVECLKEILASYCATSR
jgi:hypothetical protein